MEEETVGIMFPCGSVDAVNSIGTNKFPTRIRFITERLTIFISYRSEIICTCRSDVAILVIIFGENVGTKSFYIIDSNWNWNSTSICTDGLFKTFSICI